MATREALHEEIGRLPDDLVERLAHAVGTLRDRPLKFILDNADYDDEPLTPADIAAIEVARADFAGRVFTGEQVRQMLTEAHLPESTHD